MYKVGTSKFNKHLIAGDSIGTIESNILNCENGLLDIWGTELKYYPNGCMNIRLPHIRVKDKIIYLVGYSDIAKYKKVLGGQFGVVGIDEINIADMGFIRELFLPRFEYLLATLNPDNPDLEIYNEIINRCRPTEKYKDQVPSYIWEELNKAIPQDNWVYWFFTYKDNPIVTEEKERELLSSLLPETREYQTKILGKRTKGVGLIFILPRENIITVEQAKAKQYVKITLGVDTSYSRKSADTFAFVLCGITKQGECVALEEWVRNNKDLRVPITPSDLAIEIDRFINEQKWGIVQNVFIDSGDQATITECQKYKRMNGTLYNIVGAYKETKIIDRINLQNTWIAKGKYLIVQHCKEYIKEHGVYSWQINKDIPEETNDHCINAGQYSWPLYKKMIGVDKSGDKRQNR